MALSISSRYAPTPAQRNSLEARSIYLAGLDAPADADKLALAIGRLFQALPTSRERAADFEATVRAYCAALADIPLWATCEACMRFLKGQVEGQSHTFAPSPPELRREAASVAAPYRAERYRIGRILSVDVVPEVTAEERERALARWAGIRDAMLAGEEIATAKEDA